MRPVQLKAVWQASYCIVLVENRRDFGQVQEAGADLVLNKGVSPKRLLAIIHQYATDTNITAEDKDLDHGHR